MGPLHGDAQPRVAASPTAGAHEDVVLPFAQELRVQLLDVVGDELVVGCRIAVGLHIDQVLHLVHDAVPQRVVRTDDDVLVGDGGEVLFQHLLAVDDGAYLQQVECARAVVVQVGSELDFHRTAHLALTVLLCQTQDVCQWEHVVL